MNRQSNSNSHCFSCQAREQSEWCTLNDEELRFLNQVKVGNLYRKGQVIFYQDNPCLGVYCIEQGIVALRKRDAQGELVITRLAGAGETLGYRAFFSGDHYRAEAVAQTDAHVCFVDRDAVRQLIDKNPALGWRFLQHLAVDLGEAEEQKLMHTTLSVRLRLVHLLLSLKDKFAVVDDSGALHFDLPLSRQDMAAMLGSRPETIARTIRELEDDGVVTFSGRVAVVDDLDRLLDEIEPSVASSA